MKPWDPIACTLAGAYFTRRIYELTGGRGFGTGMPVERPRHGSAGMARPGESARTGDTPKREG